MNLTKTQAGACGCYPRKALGVGWWAGICFIYKVKEVSPQPTSMEISRHIPKKG